MSVFISYKKQIWETFSAESKQEAEEHFRWIMDNEADEWNNYISSFPHSLLKSKDTKVTIDEVSDYSDENENYYSIEYSITYTG